jgi:hypothetical protein
MALTLYDNFRLSQMNGTAVNFSSGGDTIKVAVTTSSYAVSQTADDFFNDVTNEVTGTNYTAGGATLASKTLALSSGTVTFDAADVTWAQNASGFTTGRILVLYKSTGTASTSPLIAYDDRGSNFGNVAGDVVVQWNASGIITSP